MAQYTAALAEDYNAMQREVAKILGPANGTPKSYGAYNVDGFRQSSQVSQGQEIKPAEWENLRTDLNTILWYTNDSRTGITNPVQYNTIYWADVVAYQNQYTSAYNFALSHTYYDAGSLGSDNLTGISNSGSHAAGDWGGFGGGTTNGIYFSSYAQWSSFDELNAFFNLGGYLLINLSATGGTVSTSGTKDYALAHVTSAASNTYNFSSWWNNGGSGKTTGSFVTVSSTNGSTYSPYTTGSKYVRAQTTFYYDGDRTVYMYGYAQDYALDYTADGVTEEPKPTCSIGGTAGARYPDGSNAGGGVESGYVISKTPPSIGSVSWVVYDA